MSKAATAATKMSAVAIVASVTQAIMLALSTRRRKLTAVHVWLDNKNSAGEEENVITTSARLHFSGTFLKKGNIFQRHPTVSQWKTKPRCNGDEVLQIFKTKKLVGRKPLHRRV
jgi:hypothetical protein